MVVDHQPLVSLYNRKTELPVQVAKHLSKLKDFRFDVIYETGKLNPSDYGLRHPPPQRSYTTLEREQLGVEEEEEDV